MASAARVNVQFLLLLLQNHNYIAIWIVVIVVVCSKAIVNAVIILATRGVCAVLPTQGGGATTCQLQKSIQIDCFDFSL